MHLNVSIQSVINMEEKEEAMPAFTFVLISNNKKHQCSTKLKTHREQKKANHNHNDSFLDLCCSGSN